MNEKMKLYKGFFSSSPLLHPAPAGGRSTTCSTPSNPDRLFSYISPQCDDRTNDCPSA